MTELQTFHLFPLLPTELRLKIWEHTILPRVLKITSASDPLLILSDTRDRRYRTPTPPPTILHVCQESRDISLSTYTLGFASEEFEVSIYIDYEIDSVYISSTVYTEEGYRSDEGFKLWTWWLADMETEGIRQLAVDFWLISQQERESFFEDLKHLKNLRTLVVITGTVASDERREDLGVDMALFSEVRAILAGFEEAKRADVREKKRREEARANSEMVDEWIEWQPPALELMWWDQEKSMFVPPLKLPPRNQIGLRSFEEVGQ
jgi:hypothetical protein